MPLTMPLTIMKTRKGFAPGRKMPDTMWGIRPVSPDIASYQTADGDGWKANPRTSTITLMWTLALTLNPLEA